MKTTFQGRSRVQNTAGTASPTEPLDSNYSTQAAICPLEKEEESKDLHFPSDMPGQPLNIFKSGAGGDQHTFLTCMNKQTLWQIMGRNFEREWGKKLKNTISYFHDKMRRKASAHSSMCDLSIEGTHSAFQVLVSSKKRLAREHMDSNRNSF